MPIPLVVGVDGSEASLEAVDWAADEAALHGVPLRLLHAALSRTEEVAPVTAFPETGTAGGSDPAVVSAMARAHRRAPSVELSGAASAEEPVEGLTGQGRNAFALVLGSRGLGGLAGMLLGSVSLAVAGRADCPVIVVRGGEEHRGRRFGVVVVGIEEGESSGTAAEFAYREAHLRGAALVAVHAWRNPIGPQETPLLPGSAARTRPLPAQVVDEALDGPAQRYPGVRVESRPVEGSPRQALLEAASGADLLVVGARRRRGHFGLQLGLVNHGVLYHAPCPVAVVPQI